jgi:hypothetical protein
LRDAPAQTGPILTPAEEPVLTLAEQSATGQVVAGDARLRRVLAGVPYTIADQGIWTTQAGRRLGAFLDLRLQRAASLHSSWPTMHYDERGSSAQPYSESETDLRADRVTEIYVLVDLKRRRVVSVQPGPEARVTLGPSVQVTTPQPGAED